MARMLVLVVSIVGMCAGNAAQQDDATTPEVEARFARAVAAYELGQYRAAADQFMQLSVSYPHNVRVTGAMIMRAKAFYALGENMESAKFARSLISEYPTSLYCADAHYVLALIYNRIGRSEEALQEVSLSYGSLPNPVPPLLQQALGTLVDTIAGKHLSIESVQRLLHESGPREYHSRLLLLLAEKYAAVENTRAARLTLDSLLATFPEQQGQPRVLYLLSGIAERSDVRLGVLLPLMSKDPPSAAKEIAEDVNNGIEYAAEKFSRDPYRRTKVTFVTRDTERDPVVAFRLVKEMAADQGIIGIIGPMFSSTTAMASKAAQDAGIPLVSPTANANGLAATGAYVFQANPDYEMRGRAMARYAVQKKGFKDLAVLAPGDGYGKYLANGFIDEAKRLGAAIVSTEWYERGKTDLTMQLRNMRRAGLRLASEPYIAFGGKKKLGELMKLVALGVPVKTLDSLLHRGALVNANALLGPGCASRLDSLGINVVYNDVMTDSLDIPVTHIEGVYVPISSAQEIGVASSQLVYFNIQAQILGSGEWNSLPDLDEHRRYTTGILFESDSFVDTSRTGYQEWVDGYAARFHRRPSKNSLFGYDTAEMILSAIRDGAGTRPALARALAGMRDFRGLHSAIGFSQHRVNNRLSILRFDGQNVSLVDEISVE
jgi:ABC-type branched-subunit amino acid transport system substrate-binding protein